MVDDLAGKVTLITGGAGGIGAATARRFAELGAITVIADVDRDAGRRTAAELGAPHQYVDLDVTDFAAWERSLRMLHESFGAVDVVFLNAGVMTRGRGVSHSDDPAAWLSEERIRRVVNVNIHGFLFGFAASLPYLEASSGHALFSGGIGVAPADPVYAMTKNAAASFTRCIAPTAALRGVTVSCVQPNGVDTPMVAQDMRDSGWPLNAPAVFADAVVTILAQSRPGDFWFTAPAGNPGPPWRYTFPALPEEVTRNARRGETLMIANLGTQATT